MEEVEEEEEDEVEEQEEAEEDDDKAEDEAVLAALSNSRLRRTAASTCDDRYAMCESTCACRRARSAASSLHSGRVSGGACSAIDACMAGSLPPVCVR